MEVNQISKVNSLKLSSREPVRDQLGSKKSFRAGDTIVGSRNYAGGFSFVDPDMQLGPGIA